MVLGKRVALSLSVFALGAASLIGSLRAPGAGFLVQLVFSSDDAQCLSVYVPARLKAGQHFIGTVAVINTGPTAWSGEEYRLGSQKPTDNLTWGVNTAALVQESIPPGSIAYIPVLAVAPLEDGSHEFAWRMVKNSSEWFGAECSVAVQVVSELPMAGPVTLLSPNGGETLEPGIPFDVRWASRGMLPTAVMDFTLLKVGIALKTFSGFDNSGHASLTVPKGKGMAGTGFVMLITSRMGDGTDVSDRPFSLHEDSSSSVAAVSSSSLAPPSSSSEAMSLSSDSGERGSASSAGDSSSSSSSSSIEASSSSAPSASSSSSSIPPGSLTVTKAGTSKGRQLLAGTVNESVLNFKFHARKEPVEVTSLRFIVKDGNGDSVDAFELWKDGGSASFAEASKDACGGDAPNAFCASLQQNFTVPKDGNITIIVKPRLKTDEAGAISGESITLAMESAEARGVDSKQALAHNDGNGSEGGEIFIGASNFGADAPVTGNRNVVVFSRIASVINTNPDGNGSNVPSGSKEIGQFKFTAMANNNTKNGLNKVKLNRVLFNITAPNVAFQSDSWLFFNRANTSVVNTCSAMKSSGTLIGVGSGSFLVLCDNSNGPVDATIGQGSDATFVLKATISNPDIIATNTSNVLVTLQDFTDINKTTFGPSGSHLEWVDYEDQSMSPPSFFWIEYFETSVNGTNYQS